MNRRDDDDWFEQVWEAREEERFERTMARLDAATVNQPTDLGTPNDDQ